MQVSYDDSIKEVDERIRCFVEDVREEKKKDDWDFKLEVDKKLETFKQSVDSTNERVRESTLV